MMMILLLTAVIIALAVAVGLAALYFATRHRP